MDSMGRRGGSAPPKPETASAVRAASQGAKPERPAVAKKRQYTAEFKQRILREVEALEASGERGAPGAFLRREGITWSHVHRWKRERDEGGMAALQPRKRGPKVKRDAAADELERQRRQIERLQEQLRKAEIIIDVQKKLAALLGEGVPALPVEEEP